MKKKKIAVAMSGGVDSSVAAALLAKAGNEVIGVTMCLGLPDKDTGKPACCGSQGIADARRVCELLGIRHYVLNFSGELEKFVVDDFIREYSRARTPNPCVRCNERLKFGALLSKVKSLGFDFLATGHYARIKNERGVFYLKKAQDRSKDQSYFLYRLTQEKLRHALFPLGGLTKKKVRETARRFRLPVAEKKESQEICFISGDYRRFLASRGVEDQGPGSITDQRGNVLGSHRGLSHYTIGQRSGLGIARGYPLYVCGLNPRRNRVVVGAREELLKREFTVSGPVFSGGMPRKGTLACRIRYLAREAPAEVRLGRDKLLVRFREPQFAITPGQSAVFYDRDILRGGGIIEEIKN